jgi:hypothetical protein
MQNPTRVSNIIWVNLDRSVGQMPISQGNIGHCDTALFNAISHLNRFEEGTENPRVGGSTTPDHHSINWLNPA